jgi:signal transduction histidine kinase
MKLSNPDPVAVVIKTRKNQASNVLESMQSSRTQEMRLMPMAGLRQKFLFGATVGLTTLSVVLLSLSWLIYRHQLTQERGEAAAEVNLLLQASLENAMLKRDLPGLIDIVDRLGSQPGIRNAMILAPNEEIRFASDPTLLRTRFPLETHGVCLNCPDQPVAHALFTDFTLDGKGREVMRSINAVANKPQCSVCHGSPATHPLNGVLVVDYDAAPIRQRAAHSAMALGGMGALLLLLTLVGGSWFIRNLVLKPVSRLASGSTDLARGLLDTRVSIEGNDELAQLSSTFNQMANNLQSLLDQTLEQEAFLQALVDAIPDGIRVIDPDTFLVALDNKAFRSMIGRDAGQTCKGLSCHASSHGLPQPCPPSLTLCPIHEIRHSGKQCKTLMDFTRGDGSTNQVEVIAAPMRLRIGGKEKLFIVESCRDLARIVKFSQEQKLAEMAQLATGVAHEIHNPLASVRIALHAMLRAVDKTTESSGEMLNYLKLVDGEIDRCIEITERLLKLGIASPCNAQLVEVDPVVKETLSLLTWEAEATKVSFDTDFAASSPRVLASDSELRMVVLNLAQNALHAMPNGGALHVRTKQQGTKVRIVFTDTGVGINPADAPHIFEPFYSHRADGRKGTGLGLSICRSIVLNYGGNIVFESQPGTGSTFVVELPDAACQLQQ